MSRRLGAEHNGLRTRGLAVGSSQLPWAHIKLLIRVAAVKGLVGPGSVVVYLKDVRNGSAPGVLRPGTAAPSVVRRRGGGGGDEPAGSIDGPPTASRNAATRAGDTDADALSGAVRPMQPRTDPRSPMSRARTKTQRARVSAQLMIADFFAAIVPAARSTSHAPSGVPVGGFAAPLAVRRCGE
jgi:hypothetical protein